MLSTGDLPQTYGHLQTQSKGRGEVFHANGNHKKAGVAILILGKIDFKTKTVIRDKEGHDTMIKNSVQKKRYNKYICIQHRSTSTFKTNTNKHKGRN